MNINYSCRFVLIRGFLSPEYNQARPEERRKPPVNNGCRWRQLSRGLQRILFFACEGDLSWKNDSYDNQQPRAEQPE